MVFSAVGASPPIRLGKLMLKDYLRKKIASEITSLAKWKKEEQGIGVSLSDMGLGLNI